MYNVLMYYAMMIIINGNYSRCSDISNTIQTYHPTTYLLKSEFHYNFLGLSYSSPSQTSEVTV